ncbi:hypothetical protein [Candidatus Phytoplasma tritici]|nr:hypothetical protein [Candidatus Phytoplasma tritici]
MEYLLDDAIINACVNTKRMRQEIRVEDLQKSFEVIYGPLLN